MPWYTERFHELRDEAREFVPGLREFLLRLRAWGRLHPVRAWICVILLVLLVLLIVGLAVGPTEVRAAPTGPR